MIWHLSWPEGCYSTPRKVEYRTGGRANTTGTHASMVFRSEGIADKCTNDKWHAPRWASRAQTMLARYPYSLRTRWGAAKCLLCLGPKSTIRCISGLVTRRTTAHTYLTNGVSDRLRISKTVRKTAMRISTMAAKTRHKSTRVCPPVGEVFGSEHKTYPYHRRMLSEHGVWNNPCAGRKQETCVGGLWSGKTKRTNPFALCNTFATKTEVVIIIIYRWKCS